MTADPIVIRHAIAADLDRVLAIATANPTAPQWIRRQYELLLYPGNSAVEGVLLVATHRIQDQEAITGFAVASALTAVFPVEAELESIAVDPGQQACGIGRSLLQATIDWAQSVGATELRLDVRQSNQHARSLYQSTGFTATGTRPAYYANPVEDAICMTLQLNPGDLKHPESFA